MKKRQQKQCSCGLRFHYSPQILTHISFLGFSHALKCGFLPFFTSNPYKQCLLELGNTTFVFQNEESIVKVSVNDETLLINATYLYIT